MRFMTARHNAIGAERVSILVQHYAYKGEQICFACIAKEDSVTEQLYWWFREKMMEMFLKKPENCMKRAGRSLRGNLDELWDGVPDGEGDFSFALLLCKGEEFFAFERGEMRVVFFNTAFGKSHMNYLQENVGQDLCHGTIEADVAFLLATNSFCEAIGDNLLREVFFVGETKQQWQMEKRLRELVREKIRGNVDDGGVLLVRSCAETEEDGFVVDIGQEAPGEDSEIKTISESVKHLQREFITKEILGEGAFSQVIKVQERLTGKVYACKKSRNISMLQREYRVGEMLEHPLFPQVYGLWKEGEYGYLLLEFVPGTDVKHMLERRRRFTVKQTIRVGMELAEGLLYLHEQAGLLFRDLKPENIIIRQDGRVKLLDLGCVCKLDSSVNSRAGSPGFAAPEQFEESKRLDVTCDVYGLACTMREMMGKNIEKCKKLRTLLEICVEEEPRKRIPDMRLFLNMLGELQERKGEHLVYKRGILCYKNIYERSAEIS